MTIIFNLILIATVLLVAAVFIDIIAGWIKFKYYRKCPYCEHNMTYQYRRVDTDGDTECYVFHCPCCGAFENVTPIEMLREKEK